MNIFIKEKTKGRAFPKLLPKVKGIDSISSSISINPMVKKKKKMKGR